MTPSHDVPLVRATDPEKLSALPNPPALPETRETSEEPALPARWARLRLPLGAAALALFSFWLGARLGPLTGASAGSGLTEGTWLPTPVPAAVYVGGAVRHPGLYPLRPDGRLAGLIAQAGGPSGDADLARLNLATSPHDGDTVTVPRRHTKGCAGRSAY